MSHRKNICIDCHHCSTRPHSVFNVLNTEELIDLQNRKTHLVYNYGEMIFKEGQYPSGVYIITKGKIKISKLGFGGREQIVRFAKEGDMVGYRALIGEEIYSCSATAISEVHLCFLKQELINSQIKSNPGLAIQFMKLLAKDLKTSEVKSMNMAQKSVRERVAESILLLIEMYGIENDGLTLNVTLKRDELAGIAGTVRETATRFLAEFSESQMIELSGKKIKILDFKKLQNTANS